MQDKITKALKTYRELFSMYRRVGLDKMEADAATRASMADWSPELDINKVFPLPATGDAPLYRSAELEKKLLSLIAARDGTKLGILCNRCARIETRETIISTLEEMAKKGTIAASEAVHPTNGRIVISYHSSGIRRVK
jgi:hypothetical protein